MLYYIMVAVLEWHQHFLSNYISGS